MGLESLLLLPLALMLSAGLFALLWKLERDRREHVVLLILIGCVVADTFLNGTQRTVPAGLFRPTVAGFDLRLPDIIIVYALLARFIAKSYYRPVSLRAIIWMVFFGWYFVGMVTGYFAPNPVPEILFQSKVLLWLGGSMILAAGVDLSRIVDSRAYVRGTQIAGCAAAVLLVMKFTGTQFAVTLPGLNLPRVGNYSADASTLGVSIGLPMLLLELARSKRRTSVVLPCVALIALPLADTQGAAVAGLGAVVVLVLILSITPNWRRRISVRPVEVALFGMAILGIGLFLGVASGSETDIAVSLTENVEEAFFSSEQANTSAIRTRLWQEALDEVNDSPAFGSGVGSTVVLHRNWPLKSTTVKTHNIYIDIVLRLGIVGLVFFAVALVSTASAVILVWRTHYSDLVATFVMGVGIALAGLAAKGLAESILEKYRLMVIAGAYIGLALAGAREVEDAANTCSTSDALSGSAAALSSPPGSKI